MEPFSLPSSLSHAHVAAPLPCRWCGYDLRGLSASGRCPECGARTWDTVIRALDPDAARLPRLRNPAAVGDGLFWLMVCGLFAMLAAIARPLAQWLDQLGSSRLRGFSMWTPPWFDILAGALGALALVSIILFKPPRGKEESGPVRRDLTFLALGIAAWSAIFILLGMWSMTSRWMNSDMALLLRLLASIAAIVALFGARGILGIIGQRSREYRTSRGGRQGLEAMIAAIGAAAVGRLIRHFADAGMLPTAAITMGNMIIWISTGLALVGMVYLVINAWWIRRALRQPPSTIDELLVPGSPEDQDSN